MGQAVMGCLIGLGAAMVLDLPARAVDGSGAFVPAEEAATAYLAWYGVIGYRIWA